MRAITVALRGLTVLPKSVAHFDISREKSVAAVEKAMGEDEKIFLITQKNPDLVEPGSEDFYSYGTYCSIKQLVKMQHGNIRVMVEGVERYRLNELVRDTGYLMADIEQELPDENEASEAAKEAMLRVIKDQLSEYAGINIKFAKEQLPALLPIDNLEELIYRTASDFPMNYKVAQNVLNAPDIETRYGIIVGELVRENQVAQIKLDFQKQLKENIDQNQKEYILREQLKIIQQELGDKSPLSDTEEYLKKLEQAKLDRETKEKLRKDINRLTAMPAGSQEGNVIRSYLDVIFDIPWNKYTNDNRDIRYAADILNEDHYGLDKVKERVIEYLAVRMLNPEGHSPILCLVGPPGTGKTSIARSVARALNKKYVRISLGGVRDEAEIRGHRKTYVGAMPGRIAEGIRQAGAANPLMLLDEIDKVSSDYKGDTSSALLEVLDAEQNGRFRDHYIEIPLDLSQVLFIATANTVETIPGPLLDRMELIEVSSYTENEKFHIARNYLIKKQMKQNGIDGSGLRITDSALRKIIHNYTREAGVRGLERRIGDICRKSAREILEGRKSRIELNEKKLEKYLGRAKVNFEAANEKDDIGIARGLAWTRVGGDTLQIEVNIMPGKGGLALTGQMGDVMKESAQIALSCVKSIAADYSVEADFFEKHDIHLHIPEGAVPKDGPSAGITMAAAMLSAVSGRSIKASVAMTGEITLRGRVLPVGGLKEKLLAAKMADIKTVLVPYKNMPDIEELSKEITGGLEVRYMRNIHEVLAEALV